MRFFQLLAEAVASALDRGETTAKRTLCCNVKMFDVWMHAPDCPNFKAARAKIDAWRAANPGVSLTKMPRSVDVPPKGTRGMCPHCGYPTGHYGIYTVGEKCSWCGYVERRA